jgi:osmotically inducible lipoprotein OsmB
VKKLIIAFSTCIMVLGLSACTNRELGTTGGAVVGGVAGSALTGGSTAGTIVGAVGGGIIGNQLTK